MARAADARSHLVAESLKRFAARRLVELWGLAIGLVAVGLALAILSYRPEDPSLNTAAATRPANLLGLPGAYAADFVMQIVGQGGLFAAIALAAWSFRIVTHRNFSRWWLRALALAAAVLLAAAAIAGLPVGSGGWMGEALFELFSGALSAAGVTGPAWIATPVYAVLALAALYAAAGMSWAEWHGAVLALAGALAVVARLPGRLIGGAARAQRGRDEAPIREEPVFAARRRVGEAAPKPRASERERREREPLLDLEPTGDFVLPPLSLLAKPTRNDRVERIAEEALEQNARLLEAVLDDFGVKGEIVHVRPGPVVAMYELEPAPGTKASRVIGLADDIARSMSAVSARVAVVPGRSVIGIELPNARRETVFLRELLAATEYEKATARLALALGKDISGAPIVSDLAAMPHLLIAGTTGSGKSVAINTMILSLIYRLTPEQCRFIMIDPKMLELSVYDDIPHLLAPVVTDPKKAVVALKWTVREMEDRYQSMSRLGVRNLAAYNARIAEARAKGETLKRTVQTGFDAATGQPMIEEQELDLSPMPLIVVVVDEMADLMMVAGKEVEVAIQRLSQMARAAGIHLIMATQRPSVDVITGTIKANFPTRISFQVTSKIDSRTILGDQGAEQLLGQGDMLYMAGGGRVMRVHGPFVGDEEVERVVAHLKKQGQPDYLDSVTFEPDEEGGEDFSAGGGDELYDRAVALVAREGKASTSFIQRHLQIGYNRAARIIEIMEKQGVVGPANHVGKREVLIADH